MGRTGGVIFFDFLFETKGGFSIFVQGSRSTIAQRNPEMQEIRSTRVSLCPKRNSGFGVIAMRISYTIGIVDTNYFSGVDSKSFSEENPVSYERQEQPHSVGNGFWI